MSFVEEVHAANPVPDVPTIQNLEIVFGNVIQAFLGLAGIVTFIMFLMGGFKYLTSSGDPKSIEEAKKTLTYAIGGLILIVLSFFILYFIQQFTGAEVTKFKITQ